jgi:hypothetical protein
MERHPGEPIHPHDLDPGWHHRIECAALRLAQHPNHHAIPHLVHTIARSSDTRLGVGAGSPIGHSQTQGLRFCWMTGILRRLRHRKEESIRVRVIPVRRATVVAPMPGLAREHTRIRMKLAPSAPPQQAGWMQGQTLPRARATDGARVQQAASGYHLWRAGATGGLRVPLAACPPVFLKTRRPRR